MSFFFWLDSTECRYVSECQGCGAFILPLTFLRYVKSVEFERGEAPFCHVANTGFGTESQIGVKGCAPYGVWGEAPRSTHDIYPQQISILQKRKHM